jgi:hypothetical protein
MCVYKLSGANAGTGVAATLRGQCITFQQVAAPGAVANMLPARDVHERISVMFVGPRAQLETQLGKALPFGANFSPRLDVMKRVLLALKHVENPYYKDVIIDADSAAAGPSVRRVIARRRLRLPHMCPPQLLSLISASRPRAQC